MTGSEADGTARADSLLDGLLGLWKHPPPADDATAIAAFGEVYTDPVRINGVDTSVADVVARARALHAALDGIDIEVVDRLVTTGKLAVAFRQAGRHVGPMRTPLGVVPPTGRRITGLGIDILRITDGRVSEIWVLADELQRLIQLDAVMLTGGDH